MKPLCGVKAKGFYQLLLLNSTYIPIALTAHYSMKPLCGVKAKGFYQLIYSLRSLLRSPPHYTHLSSCITSVFSFKRFHYI